MELHAEANLVRRKTIGVEPLSIERDQAVVAVEHAQPLGQVAKRVLEFADGIAQLLLRQVESPLSPPMECGGTGDDQGEKQRAAQIDFLSRLVTRIDLPLGNA